MHGKDKYDIVVHYSSEFESIKNGCLILTTRRFNKKEMLAALLKVYDYEKNIRDIDEMLDVEGMMQEEQAVEYLNE